MKTLNEYLNINVKIQDNIDFKKFQTKEEVCDFFDSKGFERFEWKNFNDIIDGFKKAKNKVYCIGEFDADKYSWWVRFGNGGEIKHVFFWRLIDCNFNYEIDDLTKDELIDMKVKYFKTFEEFKEYVKNYFGW